MGTDRGGHPRQRGVAGAGVDPDLTRPGRGEPSPDPRSRPWHLVKYWFVRLALRLIVGALLRVRIDGREHIPAGPFVLVFNHPSWIDPFLVAPFWPGPQRLYILGPREMDMSVGWRNQLIAWAERGVHFKPDGQDTRDVARRVSQVLRAGHLLAISGEGRLSDREGEVVPFVEGAAFFAVRDQVPAVPVGIVGTRWVHFGKTVRLVVGRPIQPPPGRASREALRTYTATLEDAVEDLIRGRSDGPVPKGLWHWISEAFNDRPWLDQPAATDEAADRRPAPPLADDSLR